MISFDSARSRYESDIAIDTEGNVHVVYATQGAETGVFHTFKTGDGRDWALPNRISDRLRENEVAFRDIRLKVDTSGRLHAAWSTVNTNGYSQAIYYARTESPGSGWEMPVFIADAAVNTGFTGWPSLLVRGQDDLMLIHVDQTNKGRIERTSVDGGGTWGRARSILSRMEGVNGFLIPLHDRAGGLHLVINMRPSADQRTGIYYAPRAGLDWSPVVPVAIKEPYGPSAHYTDAAMRLGNEIHVVWTQLEGGEIWHVQGTINDLAPIHKLEPPEKPMANSSPTEVPGGGLPDAEVSNEDTSYILVNAESAPARWMPFVAAIVPILLLIGAVVVWQVWKR